VFKAYSLWAFSFTVRFRARLEYPFKYSPPHNEAARVINITYSFIKKKIVILSNGIDKNSLLRSF